MVVRRRIAIVALIVCSFGLLFYFLRPSEPRYQGRYLTDWLGSYEPGEDGMPTEIQHAVRQMGTNALPRLLELLEYRQSAAREWMLNFLQDKVGIDRTDDPTGWVARSVDAFEALGPDARPALAELTVRLNDPDPVNSFVAAVVLPHLGADGIPALIAALSSTNANIRYNGAWGLSYSGSTGGPAVNLLLDRLSDESEMFEVRNASIRAVGRIGKQPDKVIPVLVNLMSHTNRGFNLRAIRSIEAFGTNASSAVPALVLALGHQDTNVARAARGALGKIAPEEWKSPAEQEADE